MPITTLTVLHYRPGTRFRALANMGRIMMKPFVAQGLTFQKLLGSGHNFGLMPNFSTYVFLGVWETQVQAEHFLASGQFELLTKGTDDVSTLYIEPYQAHGQWNGINPFGVKGQRPSADGPIVVLTRATIRLGALFDFWKHVPATRQKLADQKDNLLFAIGVGEKPIVQQCTISIWRSPEAITQFAYRDSGHKEVVHQARTRHWFSEELFARFTLVRVSGSRFQTVLYPAPET